MLITRIRRRTPFLVLIIVGIAVSWPSGWATKAQTGPTYEEELYNAKDLLRRRRFEEALKGFKRANELRDKKSAECYVWMSEAYLGLEAYKTVVAAANKAIAF